MTAVRATDGAPGRRGPGTADGHDRQAPGLIHDVQFALIEGGLHAIPWTRVGKVDTALLNFLRR